MVVILSPLPGKVYLLVLRIQGRGNLPATERSIRTKDQHEGSLELAET